MYSVLLVDDEKWVRTSLRKVIERTGLPFEVAREASHGLEALDILKEAPVDMVLTDVRMPVMNGMSFVQQLRQTAREQSVIVVSGYDDFAYVQGALRLGVTDYLLKPVEVEEMRACLEGWLQARAGGQAAGAPKASCDPADRSPVEQVLGYIREHLGGELTLTEAAARVHLNPSYLSQLFKQQLGRGFVEHIVEMRMEEAKRLLAATSLRVSEVAQRVGYTDVAYFSNTFKRSAGCTPTEYRRCPPA
ncbi:response regulator transcription factor [Paenibacillus mucilaginosus]|uniref:AraC family transcriptional regulator n=3 Tax=Paenibacillus mucilaginosus TaxID=61624 RepID=H6NS55_9BACL|nr:response regulator [Paenibacillus mucilaginosus]AEI39050.1 two component transcriptional regulator, AraC family [Paenibacillus mucilaginosus KNP414]AFC27349.1 AraC family transcriptional regulator [Paenibacillus mucilaginosus 3016]AFH59491.1 AraC family transcriptional regulator [Paenibacillus mucilaginosus K02]MCG7216182.1 response regulator [Paenibacillus mucilaginosus]WDM28087.1 response regulator [Paenibacillus mucilaginosus]